MKTKTLELQYLIEAQTKLDAVQARLDFEFGENLEISKPLVREYYRLLDYVQRLKKELGAI